MTYNRISAKTLLGERTAFTQTFSAVVQNTWYEKKLELADLQMVSFMQANGETAAKDIECLIICDGKTYTGSQGAAASGSEYYQSGQGGYSSFNLSNGVIAEAYYYKGRKVTLRIRCTSAVGTNQTLRIRGNYDRFG